MPASSSQMVLNDIQSDFLTILSILYSVSVTVTPHLVGPDCGDREAVGRGGRSWESVPGMTLAGRGSRFPTEQRRLTHSPRL